MTSEFFNHQTEGSNVKSEIVLTYFQNYASVLHNFNKGKRSPTIGYIDLFSGPGAYHDGSESTPIKIMRHIIYHPDLSKYTFTAFNDIEHENIQRLKLNIEKLNIENLTYPTLYLSEGNMSIALRNIKQNYGPQDFDSCLFFMDPWGYKELNLQILDTLLSGKGCECIFYFNYNRINAAVTNSSVNSLMVNLFGGDELTLLRQELSNCATPADREHLIVSRFIGILQNRGLYIMPFFFKKDEQNRTGHYLIFVTKHFKGFELMKDSMRRFSNDYDSGHLFNGYAQGCGFDPKLNVQPMLFNNEQRLEPSRTRGLADRIFNDYTGCKISSSSAFDELYQQHSRYTIFRAPEYRQALALLEDDKRLLVEGRKVNRKATYPKGVTLTFL